MQYVARYTLHPLEDIERGWSAWMLEGEPTLHDMITKVCSIANFPIPFSDLQIDRIDRSEVSEYIEIAQYSPLPESAVDEILADTFDIVYDAFLHQYRWRHHDGLSCWALDAETEAEAIVEAEHLPHGWEGFGNTTLGKVQYIREIDAEKHLHLFSCDGTSVEF